MKDSKTGKPKMSCRNWECGVVLPVDVTASLGPGSSGSGASSDANELSTIFSSRVPVPIHFPGRTYGPADKPWLYMDTR